MKKGEKIPKMSQYIEFYVKNGENYLPIYTCSRSGEVYEAFEHVVPYGNAAPLTHKEIMNVHSELMDTIERRKGEIERVRREIDWLKSAAGTLEERMEHVNDNMRYIDDLEHYNEETAHAAEFCIFLMNMIDEADEAARWTKNPLNLNPNDYIYCGIECGNPGIKDFWE